ncbi:MAG: tyrosine-protein phosphatase [Bacteroidota bacterium]
MGLDYTDGCVNFRDVGEYVNLIEGRNVLPEGRIYRGGSIDYIKSDIEINHARSIVNLRNRQDFDGLNAHYYHFPMANKVEKYDTTLKEVRKWLNAILQIFENPHLSYPVLIHCLSGKDRTGIVVASLLRILNVDVETVVEEYLLSDGEVYKGLIMQSLEGIGEVNTYFGQLDLDAIRTNVLK